MLDAVEAEWAIFYSITNCQEGLRGVPFGSFLIKQVVEDVSKEFPAHQEVRNAFAGSRFSQMAFRKAAGPASQSQARAPSPNAVAEPR